MLDEVKEVTRSRLPSPKSSSPIWAAVRSPMSRAAVRGCEPALPAGPPLQPGLQLFALLGADGTPIVLTDSRDAALANALQHELQTVSVH